MISWQRAWGDEYTPEKRCQIVSQRFQKAEEKGLLNYITSGVVNKQNVICATRRYGGPCQYLLFVLRDVDKPNDVLGALLGVASLGRGSPLIQTDNGSSRNYYDIDVIVLQKSKSTTESK